MGAAHSARGPPPLRARAPLAGGYAPAPDQVGHRPIRRLSGGRPGSLRDGAAHRLLAPLSWVCPAWETGRVPGRHGLLSAVDRLSSAGCNRIGTAVRTTVLGGPASPR